MERCIFGDTSRGTKALASRVAALEKRVNPLAKPTCSAVNLLSRVNELYSTVASFLGDGMLPTQIELEPAKILRVMPPQEGELLAFMVVCVDGVERVRDRNYMRAEGARVQMLIDFYESRMSACGLPSRQEDKANHSELTRASPMKAAKGRAELEAKATAAMAASAARAKAEAEAVDTLMSM